METQKLYCVYFYKDDSQTARDWEGFRDRDRAHAFVTALGNRFIRMNVVPRPKFLA